jgi:hypothetical protein
VLTLTSGATLLSALAAFAASSSSVAKATLRNRCVGWIVDAFHGCNDKELILKVRPPILSNIDSHLLEPI